MYLVRKFILAPQLEKTHKTPPSLRAEGLLFLYGLESNPESSLQLHRRLDSLEATQWAPRDTYRDPGGYQNPLLPSSRGLTHWVSLECVPVIPIAPGEEH